MSNATASGARSSSGPTAETRQALLLRHLTNAGYVRLETPLLSPASIFLDFSGEEIRSRLFLTADQDGAELCLRPEYTIPVCRAYLGSGQVGRQAAFAYCGPVFRARAGQTGERIQAGLESFGRSDIAAADAEVLALSLEAAAAAGAGELAVRLGDAGLLARVFDALHLTDSLKRRLKRGLDKGQTLDRILAATPSLGSDHSGVIAALTGADQKGARALVEDLLSIAGIQSVGGRSAVEIAERFLAQVANKASPGFAGEQRQMLDRFLSIKGDPDAASLRLRALERDAQLDLGAALDLFDDRSNFLAAHGVDLPGLTFDAAFGRNLDYYTGFVFEARPEEAADETDPDDVVIGGGRYDRLAQALGSTVPIAAVGASMWLDRLVTAGWSAA